MAQDVELTLLQVTFSDRGVVNYVGAIYKTWVHFNDDYFYRCDLGGGNPEYLFAGHWAKLETITSIAITAFNQTQTAVQIAQAVAGLAALTSAVAGLQSDMSSVKYNIDNLDRRVTALENKS